MGTRQAAKRPASGVKNTIANCRLQTANLKRAFRYSLFLCAFFVFAGNLSAQDDFQFLAEKIRNGNAEQKRDALLRIRNLETAEASRLAIPALRDSSEIVRATAAFSVIFLPAGEAFNAITPLLSDKKEFVRREAAYALGKVKDPLAARLLLQIFQKDKIAEVKNAAVVALGEIGDASAVDALTQALSRKPKNEDEADDFLRRSAARSIGQIAQSVQSVQSDKKNIPTRKSTPPGSISETFTPPNEDIIRTFPAFRAAVPVLIRVLGNSAERDDTKREAAFALGAIGDASAIAVLRASANAPDYYLAQISREALRKIEISSKFPGQ
ncbi:MAG: hypothetical protein JWN60_1140 [Acidobacteria bacterium]|jgi:HEAT repeat protein|nr:hypothetical protein [Acidobacteriota bacterium]